MSAEYLGLILLGALLAGIFAGFPIAFTLIILSVVFGYIGFGDTVFYLMVFQTIGLMKEETLAAVPLFIFMGHVLEQAGLMERLFRSFQLILAPVRGSLYLGVLLTATLFATATGIIGASVTVMGLMAAPAMIKAGYDPKLSAGTITAGGTLGILIPPSVMLVIMGPVVGVSIIKLFAAVNAGQPTPAPHSASARPSISISGPSAAFSRKIGFTSIPSESSTVRRARNTSRRRCEAAYPAWRARRRRSSRSSLWCCAARS
jgi:TRAP-type mannitol/chloroaromatic compound transport system permease large subunit